MPDGSVVTQRGSSFLAVLGILLVLTSTGCTARQREMLTGPPATPDWYANPGPAIQLNLERDSAECDDEARKRYKHTLLIEDAKLECLKARGWVKCLGDLTTAAECEEVLRRNGP